MDADPAVVANTKVEMREVDVLKQTLSDVIRLLEKRGLSRREIADEVRCEFIVAGESTDVADLSDVVWESGFDRPATPFRS